MIMSTSRSFRHFGNRSVTKQVPSIAVRIIHHKRTFSGINPIFLFGVGVDMNVK